ncbi:AAA family ATPase [Chlamydiota bacterium]
MKIAVTGKGGVGKSTVVVLMAKVFRDFGKKVILVDADPDMNLATILGVKDASQIKPISELKELIAERTESNLERSSPFFKLNPRVSDIPDLFCKECNGIKLLTMGTITKGGGGCACPINAFLKQLLSYLILMRDEVVILDMEAGIEHLGRGTTKGIDKLLIIVEPNKTSIETAQRIKKLSQDLGITDLEIIANKIQTGEDLDFISRNIEDLKFNGTINFSKEIQKMNLNSGSVFDVGEEVSHQVKTIITKWS